MKKMTPKKPTTIKAGASNTAGTQKNVASCKGK